MEITLLYQVSHYIRVKKQRNIMTWDQQNYLVIRGFVISDLFITRFHCIWEDGHCMVVKITGLTFNIWSTSCCMLLIFFLLHCIFKVTYEKDGHYMELEIKALKFDILHVRAAKCHQMYFNNCIFKIWSATIKLVIFHNYHMKVMIHFM